MRNLHLLLQTFSQARRASGTHQINGLETPHTHMLTEETDYIWARPALLARKFRAIEPRAGLPTEHSKRGAAYDYDIPEERAAERERTEEAEKDYARFTSRWRTRPRRRARAAEAPGMS